MAFAISLVESTLFPSSDTATIPAFFMAPIAARFLPSCPSVIAPIGCTLQRFTSRARFLIYDTTTFPSIAGLVFGMQQICVKPPLTAARLPLSISSFRSKPGSRKWTCKSISPGNTVSPFKSIPFPFKSGAISAIFPFSVRISAFFNFPPIKTVPFR